MNVLRRPCTRGKLAFLWFKNVMVLALCLWTWQYYGKSIHYKNWGRGTSTVSATEPSNRRILKSFDYIYGAAVVGLNESTRNKVGNFDLGHRSMTGDNSKLTSRKVEYRKGEIQEKVECSKEFNVISEDDDLNRAEIEQTIAMSEKPKWAFNPNSCKRSNSGHSCSKNTIAPNTNVTARRRILAACAVDTEPHIRGRSKHIQPYNNRYNPEHVGTGNNRASYPNDSRPNFVTPGNIHGHREPYGNQYNGETTNLTDSKDTYGSQFEGVKKFFTDYTNLGELPLFGMEKIISDCKDLGEVSLIGMKKIISDCMKFCGSQDTDPKQLSSDYKENHDSQFAEGRRVHPQYSGHYGNQHGRRVGRVERDERHYSDNYQYANIEDGWEQPKSNDYYAEHYRDLVGNVPPYNKQYDSQYGDGSINESYYDNYYGEHRDAGESAPMNNEKYYSQYDGESTNQCDYDDYYSEHQYSGGNVPQYNGSYESHYRDGDTSCPSSNEYYKGSCTDEKGNTAHYNDIAGSHSTEPEDRAPRYTQNYGPQREEQENYTYGGGYNYSSQQTNPPSNASYKIKNLEPETQLPKDEVVSVENPSKKETPDLSEEKVPWNNKDLQPESLLEENKLDDKNSSTSPTVSPNMPTLHHRGNSESLIANEKKPMPHRTTTIRSGHTATGQDMSGSKAVHEVETQESDSAGIKDSYNSSLKKNTSETKVNVKTEKDKTEESIYIILA
ncbi:hypothetical protein AK88_03623 [Plasmodium fragile]|uniref:Uncharacterized protein n=1 Tax=Plasmodium fragile TaxID=5857 RepID=A0A0D9QLW9_PLAFR|nr:uncharacterized protein AK88_03623 [Plasmodium fragile]KJP86711.1 hypothetical protein AK88_03623 [Plasmodium fragile]